MNACRICYESGNLITVCHCTGSCAGVHLECIQKWITISKRKKCEICNRSYVHHALRFPKMLHEKRLKYINVVSSLIGAIYGFTIWFDSNANVKYIWVYVISCFLFNFSLLMLLSSLYKLRMRFWKTTLYFFMAFAVGNLPGHMILPKKIQLQVFLCYGINALFMCIFLTIEKRLFLLNRQPAHQNDIVVNNPDHN